jgi:anaerobic selenocysteine-containing dehydrogenase
MASAVTGYKNYLGSDGPPVAYADLELADCFFIIGSNTAECHPIVYRRIKRRKEQAPEDVPGYRSVLDPHHRAEVAALWGVPTEHLFATPGYPGTSRLYTDHQFATTDGRARFIAVDHADPVERPSRDYPLVLTTGRVKNQWHTMTRTGKVENLLKSCRKPSVELHPQDAKRYGVQDGDFVELTSRRGKLVAQARVTAEIASGTCFVPFHWGRSMGFYRGAG